MAEIREGFRVIADGWEHDSWDELTTRIDRLAEWCMEHEPTLPAENELAHKLVERQWNSATPEQLQRLHAMVSETGVDYQIVDSENDDPGLPLNQRLTKLLSPLDHFDDVALAIEHLHRQMNRKLLIHVDLKGELGEYSGCAIKVPMGRYVVAFASASKCIAFDVEPLAGLSVQQQFEHLVEGLAPNGDVDWLVHLPGNISDILRIPEPEGGVILEAGFATTLAALSTKQRAHVAGVVEGNIGKGWCPVIIGLIEEDTSSVSAAAWPVVLGLAPYLDQVVKQVGP